MRKISFDVEKILNQDNRTIAVVRAFVRDKGELVDTFVTRGITTCRAEDSFDALKGKRIAVAKAKRQAFNRINRQTIELKRFFEDMIASLNNTELHCKACIKELDARLSENRVPNDTYVVK